MNRRRELVTMVALTAMFFVAAAAFFVGYLDKSLGYEDVILFMIATMTYLIGLEVIWYFTEEDDDDPYPGQP